MNNLMALLNTTITSTIPQNISSRYSAEVRTILAAHARLSANVDDLSDECDLYSAGLTSLSTVNLMLALEDHFDVEFPDRMLGRKTFGSIRSISNAVEEIVTL